MKKLGFTLFLSLLSLAVQAAALPAPTVSGTAFLVKDLQSGQILASENTHARIEPASLTKLMTAYLTFQALENGTLKADQMLNVSEKAYRTEGSRMFLEMRTPVRVDDLIKGMIVQSGNDACVVLAEAIAGSEEGFAALMNQEAKRLGMNESHFTNSTGLPDKDLYTTVHDLAVLSTAIQQDFPQYYPIYSIKSFTYNKITQPNRNLLLTRDPFVDGMKTGHTQSAGYNLVASTHRNNRRVLSVLVGTASEKIRADDSAKLLGWGVQAFETPKLYAAGQSVRSEKVYKGKENQVDIGFVEDAYITIPAGEGKNMKPVLKMDTPLIAPIAQYQKIGTLAVTLDGETITEREVVALQEVKAAGFFGRLWDGIVLWFKNLTA